MNFVCIIQPVTVGNAEADMEATENETISPLFWGVIRGHSGFKRNEMINAPF